MPIATTQTHLASKILLLAPKLSDREKAVVLNGRKEGRPKSSRTETQLARRRLKMPEPTLPPDLALLTHIVETPPPDVQGLFQYALTMLMVEDGKAQVVERRKIDCREWLTVLTVTENCS